MGGTHSKQGCAALSGLVAAAWLSVGCGAASEEELAALSPPLATRASAVRGAPVPPALIGFDGARGGLLSPAQGSALTGMRSALASNFSGASIAATNTLTPAALGSGNIVLLSSATGTSQAIQPLSTPEQDALYQFVLGGGCAILLADNHSANAALPAANASLLAPFGLQINGTRSGLVTVAVPNPQASLVTQGAFGTVASFTQNYPGGFTSAAAPASVLASNPIGGALAIIKAGALGPGSGPVIAFSDANTFGDSNVSGQFSQNSTLFLNAIAACRAGAPPSILGFDTVRGGAVSPAQGSAMAGMRSALASNFSGSSFSATTTLTPAVLAQASIVLLSSATGTSQAIQPLSIPEQDALYQFVLGGGCAILLADNHSANAAFPAANASLLAPFGLQINGTRSGLVTVAVPTPQASPVTQGTFGTVTSFTQNYPGGFTSAAAPASVLASNPIGGALAVIPAGALGFGSGPVIAFSDTNTFGDSNVAGQFPQNSALFLNAIETCHAAGP